MRFAKCCIVVLLALNNLGASAGADLTLDLRRLFQREAKPQLHAGIKYYEAGRYKEASTSLQNALNTGLDDADQVTAHKYLAFVHCVEGRDRQCRAHFRTALELDPSFDLKPAEAADPNFGPVFRRLKARR